MHACIQTDMSIPAALRRKMLQGESPESMDERSRLFYVAVYETDAQILGIAGLDMNEVRLLCVSPEHQRQGIGRALLEHIVAMVPKSLFADVFVYSMIEAVEFYKANGFIAKGQVSFDLGGESLPAVFMTLNL
jgi:GNAT superfamily N-acetyltransferase